MFPHGHVISSVPFTSLKVKKIIKQKKSNQDQVISANTSHINQSSGSDLVTLKGSRFLIYVKVAFLEFSPIKQFIRIGQNWEIYLKYLITGTEQSLGLSGRLKHKDVILCAKLPKAEFLSIARIIICFIVQTRTLLRRKGSCHIKNYFRYEQDFQAKQVAWSP